MKNNSSKRYLIFIGQLAAIAALIGIDQLTKYFAEKNLPGRSVTVINGVLEFTYVRNTGAAFGSFSGNTFILTVFTGAIIIAGLVLLFLGKFKGKLQSLCAVMILAGGIGNIIDRIANKYVIDFINAVFIDFPVFNFADILVTCGVIIALIYMVYDLVRDIKKNKSGFPDGENNA